MNKKRILIKISGEALMGKSSYGIDVSTINFIATEIKKVYNLKYQICLIIGGGNIFRGIKGASEGIDRSTSDYMGTYSWGRIDLTSRAGLNSYTAYTEGGVTGITTSTIVERNAPLKFKEYKDI